MKLLQDGQGNTSMMRVIALPSAVVGMGISISGAVAMFQNLPAAGTAMAVGAGMVAAALGGKAIQSRAEHSGAGH